MLKRLMSMAVAVAAGGCALLSQPPAETAGVPAAATTPGTDYVRENAEVSALLAYYQDVVALPPDELRREYLSVSLSFARDRTELGRLQLALMLCVPGAAWRDDARLMTLLEGASSRKAPADSPRRHLVELLHRLVAERQREQRRADELQQKLDSMLTIERNLRGRPTRKND